MTNVNNKKGENLVARPKKNRRVCGFPNHAHFGPKECECYKSISMAIDEYESIRLIDYEGLTQEECAEQMNVARTTVQAIYVSARKKIAECIVMGKHLEISGGDVQLCEHSDCNKKRACCCRHKKLLTKKENENNE